MNNSTYIDNAIAIVQSEQFTAENYQALLRLADESEDERIGDMIEAFIAAAPDLEFMNFVQPEDPNGRPTN